MSGLLVGCSSSDDDASSGAGAASTPVVDGTGPADTTAATDAPATGAPATDPTGTALAATDPAATDPAATDPAGTEPVTSDAPVLDAPDGNAFYTPPSPIPGDAPGDLIWARPLADAPDGSVGWMVLYRSESAEGDPIAVSGLVVAPVAPAPETGNVVLSWAHGTTGMADQCAPSRTIGSGFSAETLLAGVAVGKGWTFVATDYEGLGTPGVHPYLVGVSEGRGVLDIVRAAQQLTGSGVEATSPVAIFGHSQGGHAALSAAEIAESYATELDVIGTVAGAPPSELAIIARATSAGTGGGASGFGLMLKAGFLAAYPDLSVDAVASAETEPLLAEVADTCTSGAFDLAAEITGPQPDPTEDPDWLAVLEESSPGRAVPEGPVLIVQGDADTTVPPALSKAIRDGYCALGATVERTVYAGQDHVGVLIAAITEIQGWIVDRADGKPAPDNCADDQPV